jgi:putative membrane protein insertion efficiency factor
MPPLRKLARIRPFALALPCLIIALALVDSARVPPKQVTVKLYVAGIRGYQTICRPLLSRFVRCRYRPCCSDYCIQAAQKHGIRRGLILGLRRVLSCKKSIPEATYDPVPD